MSAPTHVYRRSPRFGRRKVESMVRRAAGTSLFWIASALTLLVIFFTAAAPSGTFLTGFNAQTLASSAAVVLILATALTVVIVSGGLDLSVGSVMTLSAVVSLVTMRDVGGDPWLAVGVGAAAGLCVGALWGALNGVLIAYARIPAFVVTLGSLGAALGVARLVTGGLTESGAPSVLQADIGYGEILGIPIPFVIAVAVAAVLSAMMSLTRFGERIYLVGSNEEGARRGGIATRWLQFRVYVLSGGLAGLAGLVDLARFDSATVATGHTTELLAALAAVIIGGASLAGGVGLIIGSAVGVFIPVVLNNGLVILGVTPFWQEIVVGAILVAAVGLDQVRRSGALQATAQDEPPPADEAQQAERPLSKDIEKLSGDIESANSHSLEENR